MKMSFGMYRGQKIEDLPTGYLVWVVENCHRINPKLRKALLAELQQRAVDEMQGAPPRPESSCVVANLQDVIASWYRDLCLRWHPDRGGTTESMQAINDAHDRLRRLLAAGENVSYRAWRQS
jgi:hypothetical protein